MNFGCHDMALRPCRALRFHAAVSAPGTTWPESQIVAPINHNHWELQMCSRVPRHGLLALVVRAAIPRRETVRTQIQHNRRRFRLRIDEPAAH